MRVTGEKFLIASLFLAILAATLIPPAEKTAVDDAYITWRYAKNLVNGHGVRWNADDPQPTQGYTSTLWLAINAMSMKFGISPLLASKAVSVVALIAIVLVAWRLLRHAEPHVRVAALSAILLFPATVAHLWSGMETVLFAAMVVAIAAVTVDAVVGNVNPTWIGVLGAIAYLTRPEGAIAATVGAAIAAFGRKESMWRFLIYSAPAIAVVALHLGISMAYFGHPLPLPAYRKILVDNGVVNTLTTFLGELAVVLTATAMVALQGGENGDAKNAWIVLAIGTSTFLPYSIVGRVMDFAGRYVYPAAISAMLGAFMALRNKNPVQTLAIIAAFFTIGLAITGTDFLMPVYGANLYRSIIPLAKDVNQALKPGEHVAAGDIGALGYYTNAHICDLMGLTNPEMAMHGNDRNAVVKFLSDCKPDLIIVPSRCSKCVDAYYFPERVAVEFARENNYTQCRRGYNFSKIYHIRVFARQPELCERFGGTDTIKTT